MMNFHCIDFEINNTVYPQKVSLQPEKRRRGPSKETNTVIYNSLKMYSVIRSRKLTDALHLEGICLSHTRMDAIVCSIVEAQLQQYLKDGAVVPSKFMGNTGAEIHLLLQMWSELLVLATDKPASQSQSSICHLLLCDWKALLQVSVLDNCYLQVI